MTTLDRASPQRIAYLINQYPKVSHTFVRREMQALERQSVAVQRYAVRGWDETPTDAADVREQHNTRYLLQGGVWALLGGVTRALWHAPRATLSALKAALLLSRGADRPAGIHLVYWAEACLLKGWLDDAKIEHLHAHFGTNAAAVAMLTKFLGGPPFSFTVHGPEEFDRPQSLNLRAKAEAANFVVAVSSFGRSQLWRWIPYRDWHKVRVVHCGVDPEFLTAPTTPVAGAPRLVCIGRLCEQKGQLLLLEAASRLLAQGVVFELVLAGDGEMRAELEERIEALGLKFCVSITGWITGPRVEQELLAARALVLPSFAEGLPVVLMEAMALSRPVITTVIAGIPELVRNGKEGWLVTAGDSSALAAAMRECLSRTPEELDAMGRAAHHRVTERHDVDQEVIRLLLAMRGEAEVLRP